LFLPVSNQLLVVWLEWECLYIQNQAKVAGKTIDLRHDPAPDLFVEVDITHTDIDKLALYARMGVSEFWRYNDQAWRIY
jgi:Uma2 family endonuclease